MKKLTFLMLVCLATAHITFNHAHAFDKATYTSTSKEIIKEALSGNVSDTSAMITKLDTLIALGITGCEEYAKQAPQHAKLMQLVIDNVDAMKALTLEEIEPVWHEGGFARENGINWDAIDHSSPAITYVESVLHPATAIIALQNYEKSQDIALLKQVQNELNEVLNHLHFLQ